MNNLVSDRTLTASLKVVHGDPRAGNINLFAIIKDEMYYLPAFVDHYRKLGVDKFFIFDDRSTDGSLEFLRQQPDCVVLHSDFTYGQQVELRGRWRFYRTRRARAGVEFKRLIPQMFSKGRWCVYADADEFLLLPHAFENLREYTAAFDRENIRLTLSTMTDFYPCNVESLYEKSAIPKNFDDLIRISPFFDNVKGLNFDDKGQVYGVNLSVTKRLFLKYDIEKGSDVEMLHRQFEGIVDKEHTRGGKKVTLIKPDNTVFLRGSHSASVAPPTDRLNCIAHFKFTPDLPRRIALALETKAWAHGSSKYDKLQKLLETMRYENGSFLSNHSIRFEEPSQLEACGRIICPSK